MQNYRDYLVQGVQGTPNYEARTYFEKKNKVALLIPVIDEGTKILLQLERIMSSNTDVDVVIADGGSKDHTKKNIEIRNLNVRAFLTKQSDGALSAQLRMGFHYCLSQDYEFVITMDGNNKDDPSGIVNIKMALESGIDFVQGSRFVSGGQSSNTPRLRYVAIRLIHAPLTSLASKYWYTDTTNGFRGHSAKLLRHSQIQIFRDIFKNYELLAYIPIRSRQVGLEVCEVPVARRYPVGVTVPTKIQGLRAQYTLLKVLIMAVFGLFNPVTSTM